MKKMKAKLISQVSHERLVLGKHIPFATPLVVYVEPSGYCNLKCAFCVQRTEGKTLKKDFMPVKLFEKLIDDLSAFPDKIKLLRICGNGEPLMNKNIVKMLQYGQEKKTADRIELITNGTLLTKDLIKNLPRFLDRIIISIEGLGEEDYQKICKAKINFQNLLDNLKALYACKGECTIHIKIHNKAVLSEKKRTTFFNMFGDCCDEIYIEKVVPMWPQLKTACYTNEFRWGGGGVTKRQVCAQIFKGLQVQANGEVVPCCVDWKRINLLGNINEDSLFEVWNGEKLRKLQIKHLTGNKGKIEPCKDCTMNDYCEFDNIDQYAEECLQRLNIDQAIKFLDKQISNPSLGLPEEIFLFISRITPMVNVDLLIKDENGRTLLSWRDDKFAGKGWHVPGGIVRFKEKLETRLLKIAEKEIGTTVKFDLTPITINQIMCKNNVRGHFISILYKCYLSSSFIPENKGLKETDSGYLKWHESCPDNLIKVHEIYRNYI